MVQAPESNKYSMTVTWVLGPRDRNLSAWATWPWPECLGHVTVTWVLRPCSVVVPVRAPKSATRLFVFALVTATIHGVTVMYLRVHRLGHWLSICHGVRIFIIVLTTAILQSIQESLRPNSILLLAQLFYTIYISPTLWRMHTQNPPFHKLHGGTGSRDVRRLRKEELGGSNINKHYLKDICTHE